MPKSDRYNPHVTARKGDAIGTRRAEILEAALSVFQAKGYQDSSVRDIAERVGILNGSLYHHFASKEDLYAEAHEIALGRVAGQLADVIAAHNEPWARLRAACIRHIELQAAPGAEAMALMSELPRLPAGIRERLVAHRDRFEDIYRKLVDDLPLNAAIDRGLYRNLLLTLLNGIPSWLDPDKRPASEVVDQMLLLFKQEGADEGRR